ncbi:MAG: hypothetical protein JSR27_02530 [Proteobacteria bacterium]|nr:hypothetical protein [Pseudomonadota bacterium]
MLVRGARMTPAVATGTARPGFARSFAGIFIVLVAVRLALVIAFAPEMPYYDEWDGVIAMMAQPMLAHSLTPAFWLSLDNEHVMLWSKALSWLQLRISDVQYDNVPVCEVSQILYAAMAAALIAGSAMALGRYRRAYVACALLVVALPYSWENIIASWANPYYFLIAFSMAAIVLAARVRGGLGVSCVAACVVAACVSMGSGPFAALAVMLAFALRHRLGDLSAARALAYGAGVFLVTAATLAWLPHPARPALHLGRLQLVEIAIAGALCMPAAWLLARIARGRGERIDVVFVCVAAWGALQLAAIVLARPEFRLWYPISRYVDVLACLVFANLACLCRLALARTWPLFAKAVLVLGIVVVVAASPIAWHWMTWRAGNENEAALRIARYVQTGDRSAFAHAPQEILPYPDRARLTAWLDAPDVRAILGDRLGTRPAPAAFVAASRRIDATLARNATWLLPLALGSGLLMLAPWWRRERAVRPRF